MTQYTYQERFKTNKGVFDEFTHRNLFELQSRNIFDFLLSPLKVGKESNVFLAKKGKKYLIIKIYRLQNCDFNKMYDYIRKDPRYEYLKKHRRDIIFAWTQREHRNLLKAHELGLDIPKPIAWLHNILIEEFIGDKEPAPQLKDALPQNPLKFFKQIIRDITILYQHGLIHGDLSAFNILNHNEKPYYIDFSQSTLTKTPNSEELLHRDLTNIVQFFKKQGIKADAEELFLKITSIKKTS
jgi:RIO kinase 1